MIHEKSPYLLQHAHNPVDWYPWGEEAFNKAKAEDKPIFLSIGYSTCHWCHVMERESFEDQEVAEILRQGFVAVKVDREERPDLDHIYMVFCQALTGGGGWPLTVIMTPELKPFYAGTYFPKLGRGGMPGLIELLEKVREVWEKRREDLKKAGEEMTRTVLAQHSKANPGAMEPGMVKQAFRDLKHQYDPQTGGFGSAPKFPIPHHLTFLLRYYTSSGDPEALAMAEKTLLGMYKGGIFDHLGFGFARYSTDRKWLAPHFEKMLYDNAQLAAAYLEAYQVTRKPLYKEVAENIFAYVLRDMTSPEGAFYSAEDADSEGVEGKFYVWDLEEVKKILGEEKGQSFSKIYGLSAIGNFDGKNILNLLNPGALETLRTDKNKEKEIRQCRELLFQAREKRVHPHKDDKILTAWNGLMITAFAMGGRILKNPSFTAAAQKAAAFLDTHLRGGDGQLLARYREGHAAYPAYLDDYAFLVQAWLELYETTYQPEYLEKALADNKSLLQIFWDRDRNGLFMTGADNTDLLIRPMEIYDGALPAGNSVAAANFLRLAGLTGDNTLEERVWQMFAACGGAVSYNPSGYTALLQAYLTAISPRSEVIICSRDEGPVAHEMLEVLREKFRPFTVSIYHTSRTKDVVRSAPFLAAYPWPENQASAYICERHACREPITDAGRFRDILDKKDYSII